MDEIDHKIIETLQIDASRSNAQLAESVGLSPSSVFERVKKLERQGVIVGYAARIDPRKLGKPLLAFVRLSIGDADARGIEEFVSRERDVLECHEVAGEDCLLLKLRAADPEGLRRLVASLRAIAPGCRTSTSLVLGTFKESSSVEPASGSEAG
jgi:Lrp/AsnC family transcriptional regulator, leucine-responsive regulatory protein